MTPATRTTTTATTRATTFVEGPARPTVEAGLDTLLGLDRGLVGIAIVDWTGVAAEMTRVGFGSSESLI